MARQFFDAVVYDIQDASPTVKRFFFRVPSVTSFDFKPGQFVMLELPIPAKVNTRSYSIASAPDGTNTFELIIVINENGLGTPYLFNNVTIGSVIKCAGPLGKFTLPAQLDHDVVMVATGTGIAPFRSMLHYIKAHQLPRKNVYLVYGNRFEKDILYKNELEHMCDTDEHCFYFHPVLSREDGWQGAKGYVHPVYEEILADRRPAYILLCGWSSMVREARDRLYAMGYTKEQVHFELYD